MQAIPQTATKIPQDQLPQKTNQQNQPVLKQQNIPSNFAITGFKYPERIYSSRYQVRRQPKPALLSQAYINHSKQSNLINPINTSSIFKSSSQSQGSQPRFSQSKQKNDFLLNANINPPSEEVSKERANYQNQSPGRSQLKHLRHVRFGTNLGPDRVVVPKNEKYASQKGQHPQSPISNYMKSDNRIARVNFALKESQLDFRPSYQEYRRFTQKKEQRASVCTTMCMQPTRVQSADLNSRASEISTPPPMTNTQLQQDPEIKKIQAPVEKYQYCRHKPRAVSNYCNSNSLQKQTKTKNYSHFFNRSATTASSTEVSSPRKFSVQINSPDAQLSQENQHAGRNFTSALSQSQNSRRYFATKPLAAQEEPGYKGIYAQVVAPSQDAYRDHVSAFHTPLKPPSNNKLLKTSNGQDRPATPVQIVPKTALEMFNGKKQASDVSRYYMNMERNFITSGLRMQCFRSNLIYR